MSSQSPATQVNTPYHGKITYQVVSLLSLCLIVGLMLNRIRVLKSWRAVNLVRFLTTSIYFLCIAFIILANVLQVRLGAATLSICKGAIILCFIFYIGTKVLLYVYLVERAHQIRGKERTRDWVFLSGMAIITVGFGVIFGLAFFKPVYGVSMKSGTCIIGLPDLVTIPLLSYDVLVNLGVTGLFMFYTRMYVRPGHTKGVVHRALSIPLLKSPMKLDTQLALVELFVMKSMIGAVVIIIAAVANLVLLIKFHGKEQGWLCFTLCTLDLTWSALVIHWLTHDPVKPSDIQSDAERIANGHVSGQSVEI